MQVKLVMVEQDRGRINIMLGISEVKWTGMGEFNSGDHYIYTCGQESKGINGVALIINKIMKKTSFFVVSSTRFCRSLWNRSTSASLALVVET